MSEHPEPRRGRAVPWGPIGSIAGVVAALAAVWALLPSGQSDGAGGGSVLGPVVAPVTSAAPRFPSAGASATASPNCVRADGRDIDCGNADAMMLISATPCDSAGAVRALGADPQVVEILVETVAYETGCAVGPTADARAAGATASNLLALAKGELPDPIAACWPDSPTSSMIPCATVHRFEPVTAWTPLGDTNALAESCRSAASRFVAGPVDVPGGRLTSMHLRTEEDSPRYRCVVASSVPLSGSVYRLSGRELPVA